MSDSARQQSTAAALRATIDEHLARRDRRGAVEAALDAVRRGDIDVESLYTLVLTPLLVDTGAAWQRGATAVWEEHFATATVRTTVEALYPTVMATAASAPRLGRSVVLACPAGEHHDLGLRMLADRLQLVGWDAYFIGADTPPDQIAAAALALRAELVILSAATHYNRVLLRNEVDDLRGRIPGVRIGVGGPAFWQDRSWPAEELLSEADLGLAAHGFTHAGSEA